MGFWKNWKGKEHFRTITYHRKLVRQNCFRVGLYRQGLMHDLSKYSPTEFLVGARYFQGDRSPNNAEREAKGYSSSWLHHKGRNKHHFEYWIDYTLKPGHENACTFRCRNVYGPYCGMQGISERKLYRCQPLAVS